MRKDKDLQDAIDIIGELYSRCKASDLISSQQLILFHVFPGVHNPGPVSNAASMPAGTLELGKPIWGTYTLRQRPFH